MDGDPVAPPVAIDQLMARVRARVSSLLPPEAAALVRGGALLVDTRPVAQRREHGIIPGAVAVERTVLEWRLDPTSPHRLGSMRSTDQPVVVMCQQGYSSVLATASLVSLGLTDVHDLAGGFEAWVAAGLPVEPWCDDAP